MRKRASGDGGREAGLREETNEEGTNEVVTERGRE